MDPPRFEADAMLEKLASYLRCVGLDAACDAGLPARARLQRAARERRLFLTRSRRAGADLLPEERILRVESEDPVEQLREVLAACGLDAGERLFTRCVRCNVELEPLEKGERVRAAVPERVFGAYHSFFGCPACGTVFWRGSHVANTCRKLGLPDGSEHPSG